jgi:putative FmdB family regulatory protein
MPIYEYECRKCNAHIEIMQKMTDKPLVKCTKCGGRLEKQWSSTSFQLKGTGWYVTDYAAKKSETKSETNESKTSSTEDKTNKADEKTSKGEEKSPAPKTETTASDKSPTSSKKNTSKNASSNTGGD